MIKRYWCCIRVIVAAGMIAFGAISFAPVSVADEKTVLIVKFEEGDQNDFASKLYRKVVTRISQHLENAGFQTLNNNESLPDNADLNTYLSDKNLLERVRQENGDTVDYVASIQILANAVLLSEGTKIEVQIRGRMLNVSNEDVLAKFDLAVPGALNAPPACNRECIIQLLEDNTAFLADSLGQVLAKRLQKIQ